jgi:hypothetical protein
MFAVFSVASAALETTIKPKKAGSTLIINMDVMCCADIGHIFSLVIDVNDKEVISDTSTKTYFPIVHLVSPLVI